MRTISVFVALFAAICVPLKAVEADFEKGMDVRTAIEEVPGELVPEPSRYIGHVSYSRECARFSYGAILGDILSEKVWLTSTETIEECRPVHGRHEDNGHSQSHQAVSCFPRPGHSWRMSAQISIKERTLLPWEREVYDVCMEGPWMKLYIDRSAYEYSVKQYGDGFFELSPLKKIKTLPDPDGIAYAGFSYDPETKSYKFSLSDKWAGEYAGNKTRVTVELYREIDNWFDSYSGKKDFTFDPADSYSMTFKESDLEKPAPPEEENPAWRGAKKFYLKWGFSRLGNVSKKDFVKKGETPRVSVR